MLYWFDGAKIHKIIGTSKKRTDYFTYLNKRRDYRLISMSRFTLLRIFVR